eukprot:TRINITY_DN7133_c0_g1_i1.p1 TRINITY_DN7133_c0_g1~~TRINITY_DN7133_c0_g1_i1.p1  ORF type:complete len:714 (-),score=154.56 TRINITY_DN7133_c0_g1_i1:357-2498(-)
MAFAVLKGAGLAFVASSICQVMAYEDGNEPACAVHGKGYNDPHRNSTINGLFLNSSLACQKLCQITAFCDRFTWYKDSHGCWLQGSNHDTEIESPFAVSGPAHCPNVASVLVKDKEFTKDENEGPVQKEDGSFPWWILLLIFSALLALVACACYCMGGEQKNKKKHRSFKRDEDEAPLIAEGGQAVPAMAAAPLRVASVYYPPTARPMPMMVVAAPRYAYPVYQTTLSRQQTSSPQSVLPVEQPVQARQALWEEFVALNVRQKNDLEKVIKAPKCEEMPSYRIEAKSRDFFVQGKRTSLEDFGCMLLKMYDEKPGDILDELLATLRSPGNIPPETVVPSAKDLQNMTFDEVKRRFPKFKVAIDTQGVGKTTKYIWGPGVSHMPPQKQAVLLHVGEQILEEHKDHYTAPSMLGLLACHLYTMEGRDINELMLFDEDQAPDDNDDISKFQDTNTVFGDRPKLRKEIEGNQAMYREANWAARVLAQAMELEVLTQAQAEVKRLAEESLRSWIKCYCAINAICAAPLKNSYHKGTETVTRGLHHLSQEDMDKICSADPTRWPSLSSTSSSPDAAVKFAESQAGQGKCVLFTLEDVNIGTNMTPLSKYPEEEILLPALLEFSVEDVSRSESLAKVTLRVKESLLNSTSIFRDFRERVMRDCRNADERLRAARDKQDENDEEQSKEENKEENEEAPGNKSQQDPKQGDSDDEADSEDSE